MCEMEIVQQMGRSIVANKKSHFRQSDEKSMKNVDKDVVNTTMGLICYLEVIYFKPFSQIFVWNSRMQLIPIF